MKIDECVLSGPAALGSRLRYRYHGLDIDSAGDLGLTAGSPATTAADLCVDFVDAAPALPALPLMTSTVTGYALYRAADAAADGDCWLVHGEHGFALQRSRILAWPQWPGGERRDYLLLRVLALWLHLCGRPPLHAAALGIAPGLALGLLARSGGGKSTLASALVAAGHTLLCDDLLPLHHDGSQFMVHPGEASLRLWPDSAAHWLSDLESVSKVRPEVDKRAVPAERIARAQARHALPLRALYLLDRGPATTPITISALSGADALLHLLGHGQMTGPAERLGLGAQRLQVFARLLREVAVARLSYPGAYAALPAVVGRIVDHARG